MAEWDYVLRQIQLEVLQVFSLIKDIVNGLLTISVWCTEMYITAILTAGH